MTDELELLRGSLRGLPGAATGSRQQASLDPPARGTETAGARELRRDDRTANDADGRAAEDGAPLRVIPLETIEEKVERIKRQADELLDVAREHYRRVQDAEVECGDGADPGRYWSALFVARGELAGISRQLTRSHCGLIHHSDPRFVAAGQVAGYCDEADVEHHFPPARAA